MFKKIMVWLVAVMFCMSIIGCGNSMFIDGKKCDTYGLFNVNSKCENVKYETIVGNVVWGILLFETIIGPVYFFGFSLYEPVGKIDGNK